ncbi:MAG: GPW/gp25 family protein [Psychrobacter alimentarius]
MASISQYKGINRHNGQAINSLEHLKQSLHDILTTPIGSRVMRRDYGSMLPFLLDQPMNARTLMQMRASIVHCLSKWERRVTPTSILIAGSASTGIDITIEYKTKDIEAGQNIILERLFA